MTNNISTYVCTECSQGFTRKSSANKHNLNIHGGTATIVRFFEYIIGRVEGKYVASNPQLFRKNNGKNLNPRYSPIHSERPSSDISYADSIPGKQTPDLLQNPQPTIETKDSRREFSDLDYMINLVSRAQKIKNLLSIPLSSTGMPPAISPAFWNIPLGVDVNTLHTQQFDNEYFFGFREEVCARCIHDAIYRLDYRGGSIHERTWSTGHECDPKVSAMYDYESRGRKYVEACDSMPSKLLPIVNRWLKVNPTIFATKLPYISDRQRGSIEIANPNNPAASICIPFLNEDLPIKFTADRDWAARAVGNEGKPTPLNGQEELQDFLKNVRDSTFGIFDMDYLGGLGYRSDHYLIYLGKSVVMVKVHTDG